MSARARTERESLAHLRHTWRGWPVGNRLGLWNDPGLRPTAV